MIRVIVLFLALFALAYAAAKLADNPGHAVIDWQGTRIELSVALLGVAALALMALAAALARLWRWLRGGPAAMGAARAARRQRQGYDALTQGLVAAAAGDATGARGFARRAEALLDAPPLTLLLSAQAAQIDGDEEAAGRHYAAMLERPETEFLGVRGLLAQASRAGDSEAAMRLARRARELKPDAPWVWRALFDLETGAGDWADARATVATARKAKLIEDRDAKRREGVLVLADGLEAERAGRFEDAHRLAVAARKSLGAFAPAAALEVRALAGLDKQKRADKAFRDAWRAGPHAELTAAAQSIWSWRAPHARITLFERLTATRADDPESRLGLAAIALDAHDAEAARAALDGLDAAYQRRRYSLIARLAEVEGNDGMAERARLAAAAAPAEGWHCGECGHLTEPWSVLCPSCGAFDSLAWREGDGTAAELPVLDLAALAAPDETAPEPDVEVEPELLAEPVTVAAIEPVIEASAEAESPEPADEPAEERIEEPVVEVEPKDAAEATAHAAEAEAADAVADAPATEAAPSEDEAEAEDAKPEPAEKEPQKPVQTLAPMMPPDVPAER